MMCPTRLPKTTNQPSRLGTVFLGGHHFVGFSAASFRRASITALLLFLTYMLYSTYFWSPEVHSGSAQYGIERLPHPRTNTSILFMSAYPQLGSSRLRGAQIMDEWKRKNNSYQSDGVAVCSREQCADICIFIGPCHEDNGLPSKSCCKVKILDVIDKLLNRHQKQSILGHLHEYDAIIVNSSFMKEYFRKDLGYNGRIETLLHHSDPRWQMTKTTVSSPSLQFGYIGTIAEVSVNFENHKVLRKLYPITLVDTGPQEIPAEVTFEMDLSLRKLGDPFAQFKTSAKVATAAALGHNIITTWEEATRDCLPPDYPFALTDSSLESVKKMFDIAIKDYEGDKVLWNKGLQMMKEVNQTLSLPAIALEYETFLDDLMNQT